MYINNEGQFTQFWCRPSLKNEEQWAFDAVTYYYIEQALQKDFYVIKESIGGSAVDLARSSYNGLYWSADSLWLSNNTSANNGGKSLLKGLSNNIRRCIDNVLDTLSSGYEVKCLLWHQGENDHGSGKKYYKNMKNIVAYVRDSLTVITGDSSYLNLPVICGTISTKSKGYDAELINSIYRIAAEDDNFHVVDMSDGTLLDSYHF